MSVSLDPEPLDDLGKTLPGDAELDGGDAATAAGTREGGADEAALEVQARLIESLGSILEEAVSAEI